MKRILCALALAGLCSCAPEKPDTSVPEISIDFVGVTNNDVGIVADIFDADGLDDITTFTCETTAGNHTGSAQINPNGTADCDITLPNGNWTIVLTITDKAGWTASATDSESF